MDYCIFRLNHWARIFVMLFQNIFFVNLVASCNYYYTQKVVEYCVAYIRAFKAFFYLYTLRDSADRLIYYIKIIMQSNWVSLFELKNRFALIYLWITELKKKIYNFKKIFEFPSIARLKELFIYTGNKIIWKYIK